MDIMVELAEILDEREIFYVSNVIFNDRKYQ